MVGADPQLQEGVREFWQESSCGEVYASGIDVAAQLEAHGRARYELEPYISSFADFERARGKDVLEVGVGMGADHLEWAKREPRSLTGVDVTPRAIEWTAERVHINGYRQRLAVADAQNLPFREHSFDLVYSWGVLHHTPNTARCFAEIHRVLRPGGEARLMIYHARSIVGYMLWLRYALLAGRPRRSLRDVYARHLESPGTKAYTVDEARALLRPFRREEVWTRLSFGDLLQGQVGQRHRGPFLTVARAMWPRWVIRRAFPGHGLMLLIKAVK